MRQLSIASLVGERRGDNHEDHPPSGSDTQPSVEVFDLFAGCGGFSTGAVMAGAKVVYACDFDEEALQVHKDNHPEVQHVCQKLPRMNIPFPTDGRRWHLHCSPPCQKLSWANNTHREDGDREEALVLVEWSLHVALTSGCQTWSLEQVSSKLVIQLLDYYRSQHPNRVSYCVFDFSNLGVPQTRRRIIAGSPHVVAGLMRMRRTTNLVGIRDVIPEPRGDYIRDASYTGKKREKRAFSAGPPGIVKQRGTWADHCRSIEKPCYTILANRGYTWVTFNGEGKPCDHSRLDPDEYAAIQTFPPGYKWPPNRAFAQKVIGNAVPPLIARLIMEIVISGT